ncbi:hypothetical protein [Microbacterium sp.]|uniref:hypothetical protein n=1 Tax=Microbacterium sp. TaxID=51671 RepID=UPI003A90C911
MAFDPWQDGAGRIIFAKRADGSYAATIGGVVISIPRQVGKTFLIGAIVFALCLLHPGMLVIWTAHQLATSGETFRSMQSMARRAKVAPYIKRVVLGSGDEAVEFTNGSRILFGARERGFGLGFTKVGVLVMDEGQRLTEKTLDDLVPTTNQATNPLIFLIGTPPRPTDAGEVFKTRRREALSGDSDDMVYIELSADPDVRPEKWAPGYIDWAVVAKVNPSYPDRTPRAAILRMRKNLGPESFRREGLGIWDDDQAGSRLISAEQWRATRTTDVPEGLRCIGVAFSRDGERVSIAGAIKHPGGVYVELIDNNADAPNPVENGVGALADWLHARYKNTALIAIAGLGGAPALASALRERKTPVRAFHVLNTAEYFSACTFLVDLARDETLSHPAASDGDVLDDSVAISDRKLRGTSGSWGWQATVEGGDETPVEAASIAVWAAKTTKRRPGRKQKVMVMT